MKHFTSSGLHRAVAVGRTCVAIAAACIVALAPAVGYGQQANEYVIGPQDVLAITVLNQTGLSGKYAVELDGSFSFPLIGRFNANGMTLPAVETEIKKRLADGFFKNPDITVAIEQYHSQNIYVVGEVRNPGAYSLAGDMTLFEALARAGSTTPAAGDELVVIRAKDGRRAGTEPSATDDVVRVSVEDLESAASTVRQIELRDGDTIYVPRAGLVYVSGEVKNPGSYPIRSDTTVLQALTLAGGVTQTGAANRLSVMRMVNGTSKELKLKLNDAIEAGDTIVVPVRFF